MRSIFMGIDILRGEGEKPAGCGNRRRRGPAAKKRKRYSERREDGTVDYIDFKKRYGDLADTGNA